MTQVKIKGVSYKLGAIPFSDENLIFLGRLASIDSDDPAEFIKDSSHLIEIRRVLKEALISGSGEEKANKAMADLTISLKEDSDLLRAINGLMACLMG